MKLKNNFEIKTTNKSLPREGVEEGAEGKDNSSSKPSISNSANSSYKIWFFELNFLKIFKKQHIYF